MSKPTAKVINRYKAKAYDRIEILVPKGRKESINSFAAENGHSINSLVNSLLKSAMGIQSDSEWKARAGGEDEQQDD